MNLVTGVEGFFGWLLQTTWQAAIVVMIILLAQLLLRHRLTPAWRHGLWFLLVARLLMPMAPSSAISIFNLAKWSRTQAPPTRVAAPMSRASQSAATLMVASRSDDAPAEAIPAPQSRIEPLLEARRDSDSTAMGASGAVVAPVAAKSINWMTIAALVWLAGAVGLLLRFLWLNYCFHRRMGGNVPVTDPAASSLLQECAGSLRVQERLLLVETLAVETPAVSGFWHKRLLLPIGLREQLSDDELRHVLLHELAHLKRHDPEMNWLMAVLQIVHWFNPVLWLGFARMRADRELATDDLALSCAEERDRRSYGETLVKVLERLTQPRALPGLVAIGESKAQIKERIRAIARGRVDPRWRWAAGAVAVVIAGLALTTAREVTQGLNLRELYPSSLTAGDAAASRARAWRFTPDDIYRLSAFSFEVGKELRIETEVADLGIGHCSDGAVWAVVVPREGGKLTSPVSTTPEVIAHVWLRFHPAEINRLFRPETVSGAGNADLEERMRRIADAKMPPSWQAGSKALMPERKDLTVDVDIQDGPRRFFTVDQQAPSARYVATFEKRLVEPASRPAYEPEVDPDRASVVAVSPPNGAKEVGLVQTLQICFDRPMERDRLKVEWLGGGFQLNGSIRVTPDGKEFTIPVRLTPGQQQKLAVNRDLDREMQGPTGVQQGTKLPRMSFREGFQDTNGVFANEFRWSFSTQPLPMKAAGSKPRVVSISPASGASLPQFTFVQVTFDQPMQPPDYVFPYLQTKRVFDGPSLIPSFDYDASAHRFTFPVLLPAEDDSRLTLRGFYSAGGRGAGPVVVHCQTGSEGLSADHISRTKAARQDPRLQKLLAATKQARLRIHSGQATVQSTQLRVSNGAFNYLVANTATFKWQGADQVYADITGPMSMSQAFVLGCDGQTCWSYYVGGNGERRFERTPARITQKEFVILDPFELARQSIPEAVSDLDLVYAGSASLEGHACALIERWEVNSGLSPGRFVSAVNTQWWIDATTHVPRQIVRYHPNRCDLVRFDYTHLNQPLPESAFRPPAGPEEATPSSFFGGEPAPDEHRFLHISDGSNGRMSGRIGRRGPNGTTSSGMN